MTTKDSLQARLRRARRFIHEVAGKSAVYRFNREYACAVDDEARASILAVWFSAFDTEGDIQVYDCESEELWQ